MIGRINHMAMLDAITANSPEQLEEVVRRVPLDGQACLECGLWQGEEAV